MAEADIVSIANSLIYGAGLGEKPTLVKTASAANISTTGSLTDFDLDTGEGGKVRAGDILSIVGATDSSDAFVAYVLGVSTDTVTVTFIDGSAVPTGTDLNSKVLAVSPMITELAVFQAINVITANFLYPFVFDIDASVTVTPDLTTGQVEIPATVREILSAHQVISNHVIPVGFGLQRNLNSAVSSTGVLVELNAYDGSTAYLTTIKEITAATADVAEQYLIASGAAALALDGTVAEGQLETAKKDAQDRQTEGAAQSMWRSFLTQRQQMSEYLSRDTLRLVIER